ncbi:sugar-phosphatase [Sediminihabitans luteus]|uniref:Sugar-phosphatase n=1 Tax=Sediminihabitans luteus TaxID=1138585 RepID=A0A2M9D082_9CELL|nr:HAD-IA family hydrolase [Sediminihabitans luteus]PJJ77513.1 sugar-phosphatase [Sediminihabitans luteus]GII98412.1 phosphatase [Sediminihabitans luteus]
MTLDLGPLAGRTFDAVLFDMDGTLIDSVPAVDRSWRRWAAEVGLPDPENFQVSHGTPARTAIARLLPADRVETEFRRIEQLELEDADGVVLLDGVHEAFAALGDARTAIVTSCTDALMRVRVDAAGVPVPRVFVTADDVSRGKPDPEPFARAASLLGVDPARCLVVEDAPAGLLSGRAAGAATLAVLGTHRADELDADAVVPALASVRFTVADDGVRVVAAD